MTKQNILNTATEQFAKLGYDGLSMNKLASELQVNKATIYYHFKDKRNLYHEVVKNAITHNQDKIEEILKMKIDLKEKFKQYIKIVIGKFKANPQIVSISLREMANLGTNVENAIEEDILQEIIYLIEIISQLKVKDKYKDMDYYLIKALIMGTTCTYYSMQMSDINLNGMKDFNKNSDDILDHLSDFISNILLDALCND